MDDVDPAPGESTQDEVMWLAIAAGEAWAVEGAAGGRPWPAECAVERAAAVAQERGLSAPPVRGDCDGDDGCARGLAGVGISIHTLKGEPLTCPPLSSTLSLCAPESAALHVTVYDPL